MDGDNKPETVVVSGKRHFNPFRRTVGAKRHRFSKKVRFILILIIVLLAGGIAAWQLWPEKKPAPKADLVQTFQQSSDLINNGQYNAAERQLTSYINSSAPTAEKQRAMIILADTLVAQEKFDQALNLLLELEKSKPQLGYSVYTTIYGLYERKGDKQRAIEYLKKAIASIKRTPEPTDDIYLFQYENKLKSLEQR